MLPGLPQLVRRADRRVRRRTAGAATRASLLIVGNGMASHKLCEKLRASEWRGGPEITVVGEEPVPAYDRIHLTDCFSSRFQNRGRRDLELAPASWYRERGIRLLLDDCVVSIHAERREALTRAGLRLGYDTLVLATGSKAFVPPLPGTDLPGVFTYRTLQDLEALIAFGQRVPDAVVVGGGLLGLEAARALMEMGKRVTVLENSGYVMSRQLHPPAAEIVAEKMRSLGVEVRVKSLLASIVRNAEGEGLVLTLEDGFVLRAGMVVIAAGVRPRDELAQTCGLQTGPRGGFVVDDSLRTSLPDIYAVGECAVHRGVGYGLAAPGFRMAEALAETLRGKTRKFTGADQSTTLKVMGVDVHILGEHLAEGEEALQAQGDSYRQLTLRGGRLLGAIAVGPWPEAEQVRQVALRQGRVWPWQIRRFRRGGNLWSARGKSGPESWPATALVCHCNQVNKGTICAALQAGCASVEMIRKSTGASAVCGGCEPLVQRLLGAPVSVGGPGLWLAVALVGILVLASFLSPSLPVAQSVQTTWHRVERLWRVSLWHQVSGYVALGFSLITLLFPLRKRIPWFRRGSLAAWRQAHILLGGAAVLTLAVHTGLRLGNGFNLFLSVAFLVLNLFGAFAGGAFAWAQNQGSPKAASVRTWLTRGHLLFFWPFPLLVIFHLWTVYLF